MKDFLFVNPAGCLAQPSSAIISPTSGLDEAFNGKKQRVVSTNALQMRCVEMSDYELIVLPERSLWSEFDMSSYDIQAKLNVDIGFASSFLSTLSEYRKLPLETQFIVYTPFREEIDLASKKLQEFDELQCRVRYVRQDTTWPKNLVQIIKEE